MKLAQLFDTLAPYLEGRASAEDTQRALYGATPGPDAHRLALYERFCREHRTSATGGVHSVLREVIEAHGGEPLWRALVEDYFTEHPMQHVELNENGAQLASFLGTRAELPAWWAALADFEWWEWQTLVARDAPADATPDEGPLRIASTVELRPYAWDFVSWLDAEERAPEPAAGEGLVLFWRDLELEVRRAPAALEEVLLLKRISEGLGVEPGATLEDLRAAGIILGARTA